MSRGVSASTIKSWFQYRCERKTRYELMNSADLDAVPVHRDDREHALKQIGEAFELRIVAALDRREVLRPANGAWSISEAATVAFLRGDRPESFAYQVNLRPRHQPLFLAAVPDVEARPTKADLIRIDRSGPIPVFTIMDIKASRKATSYHKIQVAYYALLLDSLLRELGLPGKVHEDGEIWRISDVGTADGDQYFSDSFRLRPYMRAIEAFCRDELPRIAGQRVAPGVDETFFHLYFKCEQCAYLDHCMRSVSAAQRPLTWDVSAVAGLTHEGKRTLNRLGIHHVGELAKAKGLPAMADLSWSLRRRGPTLLTRAAAVAENRVLRTDQAHTFLMPARTDVSVYLVADHDPLDNSLATLACFVVRADGTERQEICVMDAAERRKEADALAVVFGVVLEELGAVDRHNAAAEKADDRDAARHAHIFVYEPVEARYIQEAVKRHIEDSRVRAGLLNMVRLFPPDDRVPEPEFRGIHHLPATALRSVVEQLFALSTRVSYDLRQVSQALQAAGLVAEAYNPPDPFAREFSSLLSMEVIRGMREQRAGCPGRPDIEVDVLARLRATHAIAGWLRSEDVRQRHKQGLPLLHLQKRPFRFQATFNPLSVADLDMLQAFELIENRAGMLERLVALAKPLARRLEAGEAMTGLDLIRHDLKGGSAYLRLRVPSESRDSELGRNGFGLILTNGDPSVILNPSLWGEVSCRLLPPRPGEVDINFLTVRMSRASYLSDTFQAMLRSSSAERRAWVIDQSFVDPNTPRIAAYLAYLAMDAAPTLD